MGRKKIRVTLVCPVCGIEYETYPSNPKKTCSKKCMGINQTGENNPNFGKKWSDEQRQRASEYQQSVSHIISERVKGHWDGNDERRKATALKMAETRPGDGVWLGRKHSDESKQLIGLKSSAKFTEEYKSNYRKTMEDNGRWVPLDEKSDYEIYYKEADWIERMFDIVYNGIAMINEYGVFNPSTNYNGVVRDHIVGRKYGYAHRVFPQILRHPSNCQIIQQPQNKAKGHRGKNRPDCDITLKELFERIRSYNGEWSEHNLVLSLIKDYESGKRWER